MRTRESEPRIRANVFQAGHLRTEHPLGSLFQFIGFQAVWFAAVLGAARGAAWWGVAALVPYLVAMLASEPERERGALLLRWIAAGLLGSVLDSALHALGWIAYPERPGGWPAGLVPPFIVVLWVAFATLPRFSLAWLAPRPGLAACLGALGGPLSFAAGARLGVVSDGGSARTTATVLALEYALLTPLFLRWLAPRRPTAVILASPRPSP